ncbi:hypothetical protein C0989_009482 [Termitomyces sp. Mn162]|nr:hypothetical protein C0989_009482 [Termitomyces sp. Mn162]
MTNPTTPGVLTLCQPVAPHIHPTNKPLYTTVAPKTDPSNIRLLVPDAELMIAKSHIESNNIPLQCYLAEDAFAFLATLDNTDILEDNNHIPEHYGEVMRCANLWVLAMEQELKDLREREVFKLVP